ncbi:hypothetical protein B0H16DRAFT_1477063 [Mycena metata]|uniref:Uncharacterized protein n=1 Tax=Mycena metata TaxID=1033252 RepID=A0AAD7H9Z2_9AGAR|nr:hypothetical protein B0H16DRAFT_1477063 [Mycena metata]
MVQRETITAWQWPLPRDDYGSKLWSCGKCAKFGETEVISRRSGYDEGAPPLTVRRAERGERAYGGVASVVVQPPDHRIGVWQCLRLGVRVRVGRRVRERQDSGMEWDGAMYDRTPHRRCGPLYLPHMPPLAPPPSAPHRTPLHRSAPPPRPFVVRIRPAHPTHLSCTSTRIYAAHVHLAWAPRPQKLLTSVSLHYGSVRLARSAYTAAHVSAQDRPCRRTAAHPPAHATSSDMCRTYTHPHTATPRPSAIHAASSLHHSRPTYAAVLIRRASAHETISEAHENLA